MRAEVLLLISGCLGLSALASLLGQLIYASCHPGGRR